MPHLSGSNFLTTSLGLGCAALSAGSSRHHNRRLVDAAFLAGIRHFDVAPPYGMGTAEDVLGDALKGRRQQVTVTTKVGIARPRQVRAVMLARSLAAPVRRLVPQLTRRIGASTYRGLTSRPRFNPSFVEGSVHESLRFLQTDYLDILLLHEVSPADITTELLEILDNFRRRGIVRLVGTATSYESTRTISLKHSTFFDVWQYSWCLLDEGLPPLPGFAITHGSIQRAVAATRSWLSQQSTRTRHLSDEAGVDLTLGDNLAHTLLGAALAHNPNGITLVSTRQKSRIESNSKLLTDDTFVRAGRALASAFSAQHVPAYQ